LSCELGHQWTVGEPRPDPATGAALTVPTGDHDYLRWIAAWPDGYVLNCLQSGNPVGSRLHRARCKSISQLQPDKETFVGEWIKVCSTDRQKVRQWALAHLRESPANCQHCM
jgi:hypothetical protein